MANDFEDYLIGSPWQSHGAVCEVEVIHHRDMDDAYTDDDDTDDDIEDDHDDDTDDDNDGEAIRLY